LNYSSSGSTQSGFADHVPLSNLYLLPVQSLGALVTFSVIVTVLAFRSPMINCAGSPTTILSDPLAIATLSAKRYLLNFVEVSTIVFIVYPFTIRSVADTAVPAITDGLAAVKPMVPSACTKYC